MGFEALLGNERLKENLRSSIARGRLSHFYLISGPEGSGKRTLAQLLAAAAVCREQEKPCLRCAACRKVLSGNHPDVITVADPEHKNVPVKLVRAYREDAFIRPNEAERKVYIFPQPLGLDGQNSLLKLLEEPPAYGVFLLLTDNPEKLLPTVRSRCTPLALTALPKQILYGQLKSAFPQAAEEDLQGAVARSGGYLGQAKALLEAGDAVSPQTQSFAEAYAVRNAAGILQVLAPMEKWKRDALIPELNQWAVLLQDALVFRAGSSAVSRQARQLSAARSGRELMAALAAVQKAMQYAQGNVSPAAVCGYLVWALR